MYGNINQGGYYGTNSYLYPQINPPINTPSTYAQQMTPTVLPGRMVDKGEDIMVGEVPTDGSLGLFPQKDGSCIYAKSWNSDGTIRTMKFVPMEQDDSAPRKESVQETQTPVVQDEEVNEKLDLILDLLTGPNPPKSKSGVKNQNGSDSKEKE